MKVYVVFCHPVRTSLVGSAFDRTLAALHRAGHEVRSSDLYADGFVPELSLQDKQAHLTDYRTEPELRPDIARYVDQLRWCDALVFVYPTWWSGQPAMLKGWIDRVFVQGVAWELPEGANRLAPLLQHITRIVAVTTHGSPKYVNVIEGEAGKRVVTRSLRVLCSRWCRTRWIACYNVDRLDEVGRERFLRRVERRVARL